ncbi:MAG: carboxypeptidase-like regulatory domain-containing protein [Planctomycetota bacterium JB042]
MSKGRLVATLGIGGGLLAATVVLLTGGGAEPARLAERSVADGAGSPEAPAIAAAPTAPPPASGPGREATPTRAPEVVADETASPSLRTAVRGIVVDRRGKPVRDAEVRLGRPLWTRSGAEFFGLALRPGEERIWIDWRATTDAAGRFEFANPTPGTGHLVRATLPDGRVGESERFHVPPLGAVDVGRVTVAPGGTLRGVVVEADGTPVPGVLVFGRGFPSRTDGYGRFDLGLLPRGPVEPELARSDWRLVRECRFEVPPNRSIERRLVARRQLVVAGAVVDPRGAGVKGRRVDVAREEGEARVRRATTDADGAFRVPVPVPEEGRYRVTVWDDEVRAPLLETIEVVPAASPARIVVADVVRLRVTGRAREGGPPLLLTGVTFEREDGRFPGPWLSPDHPACARGPRGSLVVRPPPRPAPRLRATADGYWVGKAALPASGDELAGAEVEVVFGDGATMHVLVRTADDRPVADAGVRLDAPGGRAEQQTDRSGSARFRGLVDGRYDVTVTLARGLSERVVGVPVEGGRVEPVVVRLAPAGNLHGVARDPDGEPAVGVDVLLRTASGWLRTRTRADGTYRVADAPAGPADLFVELDEAARHPFFRFAAVDHAGPHRPIATVELRADASVELDVLVPWRRPGALVVRCVDAGERPVRGKLALVPWALPGGDVAAGRTDGGTETFDVGPAGRAGFPRLAPLRYSLLFLGPLGVRHRVGDVEVVSGGRTEVSVRVGATRPVEGIVVDEATGAPRGKVSLRLFHADGLEATATVASGGDGRFRFPAAPDGRLSLCRKVGAEWEPLAEVVVGPAAAPVRVSVP